MWEGSRLASSHGEKSTDIKKNKTRYICVQRTGKNGKYKVTIRELDYMETSSHVTVSVMDKDGNFKEERSVLKKDWNSAYRYYRLAENSTNAYDAYHWMYLTLERVLNDRVPKEFGEEEGKWLKKALETVAQECDWYKDLYEERNYLDCFLKEQYTDVRCKLFHAKENVCLPNEWPTQYLVYQTLNKLEKVCQRLMKYYYKCRIESGGLTEAGFYFCGCRPIEKSTGFLSMEKVSVDAEKLGDAIYLEQDDEKTKLEDGVFTVTYEGILEADKKICVKDFGICAGNNPLVVGNFKGFELLLENVSRVEYVYRLISKSGNRPTVRYLMV